MNRRQFLKVMGGGGLALPGLLSASGCAPTIVNPDPSTGLLLGYVSGDVGADNALVWLKAEAGSRVSLRYGKEPGLAQFHTTPARVVDAGADHSAIFSLDRLEPIDAIFLPGCSGRADARAVGELCYGPALRLRGQSQFLFQRRHAPGIQAVYCDVRGARPPAGLLSPPGRYHLCRSQRCRAQLGRVLEQIPHQSRRCRGAKLFQRNERLRDVGRSRSRG